MDYLGTTKTDFTKALEKAEKLKFAEKEAAEKIPAKKVKK